ncbi:MAG: HAMP domain-containing histidine kinase [Euryarchaeota archaeon]|nr:HAMP domain-containing histidine kinase [Euryarchaeota archaeon]
MESDTASFHKALVAERQVAGVRTAVILFNIAVYYLVMDKTGTIPWLAHTISITATAYTFYVLLARPYIRYPVLVSAYFTSITDAALITLWILATGGLASPFYILWYISLVAIAFRFGRYETLVASVLYLVSYLALLLVIGDLADDPTAVLVRGGYILLIGALGGLLAKELSDQTRETHQFKGVAEVMEREVARQTQDLRASRSALEQALEETRRANERLKDLDRIKTRILNTASHELNTPLTPLKMQVHLLSSGRYGALDDEQKKSVEIIHRNLDRLIRLVHDMVDVSRLESDRLKIEPVPARLDLLVTDALDAYEEPAKTAGIRLEVDPGPPVEVVVDTTRFVQVLTNLVSNALKFTPRGGVVSVETTTDGGEAALRVRDTGLGLDTDQMARLFLPFEQVQGEKQAHKGGTGLGLFISKGLIDAHGGRLEVESAGPGQGSTFTIRLPLRSADAAGPPEADAAGTRSPSLAPLAAPADGPPAAGPEDAVPDQARDGP